MGLNNDRLVKARVNNVDEGTWDKRAGGKTDSSQKKYHPGGGRAVPPINLDGKQEIENITCERGFDTGVVPGKLKELRRLCGKQTPVQVTELELDPDGNIIGEGETYIGTLKAVWKSDTDSENDDEGMIAFEVNVSSIV